MCGRFVWHSGGQAWVWATGLSEVPTPRAAAEWLQSSHFNVAPSSTVALLASVDGTPSLELARWGLVPHWTRSRADMPRRTFNARVEGIESRPTWRLPVQRRQRCLVPATGFYEWTGERGSRVPHYLHRTDGRPVMFAGLWSRWRDPDTGEDLLSCTIITTGAGEFMAPIHHRQPAILAEDHHQDWIDPDLSHQDVAELFSPGWGGVEMSEHIVSTAINSSRHRGGPESLEPVQPG